MDHKHEYTPDDNPNGVLQDGITGAGVNRGENIIMSNQVSTEELMALQSRVKRLAQSIAYYEDRSYLKDEEKHALTTLRREYRRAVIQLKDAKKKSQPRLI